MQLCEKVLVFYRNKRLLEPEICRVLFWMAKARCYIFQNLAIGILIHFSQKNPYSKYPSPYVPTSSNEIA